jgi:hypothetical protein
MKTTGLRKSKNIQDARGRSVGSNDYTTNLSAARDRKMADKFFEGKLATASKSKMAKDAGLEGVDKASKKKKLPTSSGNVYKGKR